MLAAFPVQARAAKVTNGRAVLDCRTDHAGYLVDCKPIEETPQGLGFGEAAQVIAGEMRVNPWTFPGLPTDGATVRLPLRMTDAPASEAPSEAATTSKP